MEPRRASTKRERAWVGVDTRARALTPSSGRAILPRGHPMPEQSESRPVSPWSLMLGTGPRFARDAFGPVLVFYLGWKLVDLRTGVLAATALAVVAYVWERRRARSGVTGK